MIINRALIREILQTCGAVTLVMVSIFMVIRLVGLLREAAKGDIPIDKVLVILLLKLVTYMDVLLPLMLFVSMLMVMGRWNRDNEMAVIAACGIGLNQFLRPIAVLLVIVGAVVATFSVYLAPLAVQATKHIEEEFLSQTEVSLVTPGVFTETRKGRGVYFVEEFDRDADQYRNIFAYMSDINRDGVVVARSGHREIDEITNDQFLVLTNGTRYEGNPGQPDYRIIEFETYAIRLKQRVAKKPRIPIKGRDSVELLRSKNPRMITEWHWRLAKTLALPALMLFALACSNVNARKSRLPSMLVALVFYFAYTNAVGVGFAMLKSQTIDVRWGLWWVHLAFLAIATYAFVRRAGNRPMLPRLGVRQAG